ncbi:response regulator [Paenibacillus sp. WQ 127069]|uniref:Response regulator n=1 Tax=Paenibacillus baimaensis TaxID=2982185 RepID=A0ABT2UB27_9BACL|nr:response regulator [Paenibacillus sp. WQ 127069]MCU6791800.1 response regulator [Paenibacillus sp. WQ 127069]
MKGTLLIVDDEPLIRKGLRKLVESNALHWEIVGEASNGQEAIVKLGDHAPDLVLTDIRMPGLDGIQLAEYIHRNRPNTAVIILTGHRDFEYAQAALRFGVKDFLLKPCPEKEVCRILTEVYELLYARLQARDMQNEERRRMEENVLRSQMLQLPVPQTDAERLTEAYNGMDAWCVCVITYFPESKAYRPEDLKLLQFSIMNIMQELFEQSGLQGRIVSVQVNQFVLLLNPSQSAHSFFSQLVTIIEELLAIPLFTHYSGRLDNMGALHQMYQEGLEAYEKAHPSSSLQRFTYKQEERMSTAAIEGNLDLNYSSIKTILNEVMSFILLGKSSELQQYAASLVLALQDKPIAEMKLEALTIASAFQETERRELGVSLVQEDFAARVSELHPLQQPAAIMAWTEKQIERFFAEWSRWLMLNNDNLIGRAIRFIEQHYMDECTLAQAAEHVHLSLTYFSNLFKKDTGESFTNYLTKVRVDKAKMLLRNTGMKIAEIAEAVGYADPNYFAAVFKQTTKQSPSEFRKGL